MSLPLRRRLEKKLAAWRWQRLAVLGGVSLALALMLVIYLFGGSDRFFGRLFSTFFVLFWLLTVAYYGIIPFVTWASGNWFGQRWRAVAEPVARPRRAGAPAPRVSSSHAAPGRPDFKK